MINPIPNFTAAGGLNLLSHILEIKEANAIMKNEFKILNQETVISVVAALNSLYSIHKAIPHTPIKAIANITFDKEILEKVFENNFNNTQVTIHSGTMV